MTDADQNFIEMECKANYPWQENRINEMVADGWRVLAVQYEPKDATGVTYYRIAMTRELSKLGDPKPA